MLCLEGLKCQFSCPFFNFSMKWLNRVSCSSLFVSLLPQRTDEPAVKCNTQRFPSCNKKEFSNLRTLCTSSSRSSISSHGHSLLQFLNVGEILQGTLEFPAVDGLCGLTGVLEADTKITATAASRFGTGDAVGGGVADLLGGLLSVFL